MKKSIALTELFAGMTIKKVFVVLASMSILELAAFWIVGVLRKVRSFQIAIESSGIVWIFCAAFAAMLLWALSVGKAKTSRYALTFKRLNMSDREGYLAELLWDLLCFILLILTQMVLIIVMSKIFEASPQYAEGPQGIYIDLRMSVFLRSMFPAGDTFGKFCLIAAAVFGAVASCYREILSRESEFGIASVCLGALTLTVLLRSRSAVFYEDPAWMAILLAMPCLTLYCISASLSRMKEPYGI